MPEEFQPLDVIGQPYKPNLLPYGGGVSMRTGRHFSTFLKSGTESSEMYKIIKLYQSISILSHGPSKNPLWHKQLSDDKGRRICIC